MIPARDAARQWLETNGITSHDVVDSLTQLLGQRERKALEQAAEIAGDIEGNCDEYCRARIQALAGEK